MRWGRISVTFFDDSREELRIAAGTLMEMSRCQSSLKSFMHDVFWRFSRNYKRLYQDNVMRSCRPRPQHISPQLTPLDRMENIESNFEVEEIEEWKPLYLAAIVDDEDPLQFARVYNETWNRPRLTFPFPREIQGSLTITNPYGEGLIRSLMTRDSNIVNVETRGRINAGQPVIPVGDGFVMGVDPGREDDRMIVGRARRDLGNGMVEVELETISSVSPSERLNEAVELMSGSARSLLEEIEHGVNQRLSSNISVIEKWKAKPKNNRKYYTAETGLKRTPVIQNHHCMYLGGDRCLNEDYHGCKKCFWYSLIFFKKQDVQGTRIIETDEDFEKVKANFVKHFNKAHKDVVAKKMSLKNPEKMT